jgi:transcriptional regulator with XRE-family HTH domain
MEEDIIDAFQQCQVKFYLNKVPLDKNSVKSNFTCIMSETFGQWLKRRRLESGYNRTELAQRSRTTKATISLYELDKIDQPRRSVVDRIAKALAVPIDEARTAAGYAGVPIDDGFYRGIKDLSPERQALARRQIRAIIDALAEEENPDTDYIDDEDPNK